METESKISESRASIYDCFHFFILLLFFLLVRQNGLVTSLSRLPALRIHKKSLGLIAGHVNIISCDLTDFHLERLVGCKTTMGYKN